MPENTFDNWEVDEPEVWVETVYTDGYDEFSLWLEFMEWLENGK